MTENQSQAGIKKMEKELTVREAAAPHLTGIPKIQNRTAIDRIYDELCHANLAVIEAAKSHIPATLETSTAERRT